MFARIDTDNDGQATFSDLLGNLPAVLQIADSLADVGDTTDSPDESDSAFHTSQPEPKLEPDPTVSRSQARRMRAIFDGCDVDGDGMLSASEVEELLFRLDVAPIRGRRGKALRRRESVCGLLSELEPQQAVNYDQFQSLMLKALSRRSDGGFDPPCASANRGSPPTAWAVELTAVWATALEDVGSGWGIHHSVRWE